MISLNSEAELLESFRDIDREEVQLPAGLHFPLILKDYFAWTEPSGHRVFLIFQDPKQRGHACGIVFKRGHFVEGPPVMQMCQWCHSVRGGSAVTMLTAAATKTRKIGVYLCRDLSCKDKVLGPPGVNDLREPYARYEKLYRVLMNMSDFARIDLAITRPRVTSLH